MDQRPDAPTAPIPYQWAAPLPGLLRPAPPGAGRPRAGPDPGGRVMELVAAVCVMLLVGVLVVLTRVAPDEKPDKPQGITAPTIEDPFLLPSKLMIKLAHSGLPLDAGSRHEIAGSIEKSAKTPVDRFRAAIAVADVLGPEAGAKRLDELERAFATQVADAGLEPDLAAARTVLAGHDPTDDERNLLVSRHGWFGELLLSHDLPDADPGRAPLIAGGWLVIAVVVLVIAVVAVGVIGGLICFTIAVVKMTGRRAPPAFDAPSPGGSVYLETVAVFIAVFLALHVGMGLWSASTGASEAEHMSASVIAQWGVLLAMFWPLVRGVPWSRWRADLGWRCERGVLREIGAGLFMYLAGLPILGVAVGITLVIILLRGLIEEALGGTPSTPENPILQFVTRASPWQIAALVALAVIWAPIVEETVFRGALFRHLRSRTGVLAAAVISALAFGIMHGYELLMLLPVISLGFIFALMREWRGSLVPSVVAHSLHNATLMLMLVLVLCAAR